ncbi:hypothetical protein Scep_030369 [Stephania cephalantha]|uniref:Uncharacterized protein n=1 Tax=Stephania cephalantha TaxID=152367 RepID=A0AAP0E2Q6_9MAGN
MGRSGSMRPVGEMVTPLTEGLDGQGNEERRGGGKWWGHWMTTDLAFVREGDGWSLNRKVFALCLSFPKRSNDFGSLPTSHEHIGSHIKNGFA